MFGTLYLCATPIGNLGDITLRVLELLRECDLIAAEDTRQTLKLLNHFEIKTPMTSYYEHNKEKKGPLLVERLKNGENIALVTDAGMPGISDPGFDLARLCIEKGIRVSAAPGANAALTALIISGLDSRRFVFEGFLPPSKKERECILSLIKKEPRTLIFYEAPHHLLGTLKELFDVLGNRNCAVIRELTKKYEEVIRLPLSEQIEHFSENSPKGEFVIVVEGLGLFAAKEEEQKKWESLSVLEHMEHYLSQGMREKEAMKLVAKDRSLPKREIYSQILKLKEEKDD